MGVILLKSNKGFFLILLLAVFALSLSACGNNNNLPRNINAALVGSWELYDSNMWGLPDTVEFRGDATGTMSLGAVREEFSWSVNDDELVIVQGGGLLTLAYTITELTSSRLSYKADIPGFGFVRATYTR